MDVDSIFVVPGSVIARSELLRKVHVHSHRKRGGACLPVQLGVRISTPGHDEHHRPVAVAEHTNEGVDVGAAGPGTAPRMRVNPDPAKLFRLSAEVHLLFEKVRDRAVLKCDKGLGAVLLNQLQVLHEQQIVRCGNSEPTDFGGTEVTQVPELRPGCRAEPQLRTSWSPFVTRSSRLSPVPETLLGGHVRHSVLSVIRRNRRDRGRRSGSHCRWSRRKTHSG